MIHTNSLSDKKSVNIEIIRGGHELFNINLK
ncbi:Uncharacterised protein [Salmonella enterica subsp. arizonae]|nr:Uncharacterised protein [Salmonella enterica subsp. arizonae]